MSQPDRELIVGAVAYHSRVVVIWEGFRAYFATHGVAMDYVLYSNYERLVDAVLAGDVDIGWNTNTAYVVLEHRLGTDARLLGMRDIDRKFATVVVTRRGDGFERATDLAGQRLALGCRDSGHAAILPMHYLAAEGLDAQRDCTLVRFDTDLGKHGDTGDSELQVVRAVAEGDADAGALGAPTWARFRAEATPATTDLEVAWQSETYSHCNFTALPSIDAAAAERWEHALLAMDYDDPAMRPLMDLEGVKRWHPGDPAGYVSLREAMAEQGYLR